MRLRYACGSGAGNASWRTSLRVYRMVLTRFSLRFPSMRLLDINLITLGVSTTLSEL